MGRQSSLRTRAADVGLDRQDNADMIVHLRSLCERLRSPPIMIPPLAYELLAQCLELDPRLRCTAADALHHSFCAGGSVEQPTAS